MPWKPDYATLTEIKSQIRLTDTADDVEITAKVSAASRAIDDHCNRQFGQVAAPVVRYYTPKWRDDRGRWVAVIDDLMTTTSIAVASDAGTVDLYTLEPRNAAADGKPWTRIVIDEDAANPPEGNRDELAITALWGWTAVPSAVKEATKLQTSRLLARRDSPLGTAGSLAEGSEIRLLAKLDPDVAVMLRDVVRPAVPR